MMSQRTNLLSATLMLLSLILFLSVIWRGGNSGQAFQESPLGFVCELSCSDTALRTSIAELSWEPQAANVKLAEQVLEVTVFKDGFAREVKARLPLQDPQRFTLSGPAQSSQASLARLEVAAVEVRSTGRAHVRVQGLEPNLNYFWRLQSADGKTTLSGPLRSRALVCPADEAKEVK